jgi:hypothetical protein
MSRAIITTNCHDSTWHLVSSRTRKTDVVTRIDISSHPPNPQVLINGTIVNDVQQGLCAGLNVRIEVNLPAGDYPAVWIDGVECVRGSAEWESYIQPYGALRMVLGIAAIELTVIVRFVDDTDEDEDEDEDEEPCDHCGCPTRGCH